MRRRACRARTSHLPFPAVSASITLAIDTSGPLGGIALGRAGESPMLQRDFGTGPKAGGELFVALDETLSAGPRPERIVVGVGPGSYAGVRMAIAAARGLGLAFGVEPVALPSVCAYEVHASAFHAIGDARRGTYYYSGVQDRRCVRGPEICEEEELRAILSQHPQWPVLSVEVLPAFPQAWRTTARAVHLISAPAEEFPRPLEPIYLREPHITRPRALTP